MVMRIQMALQVGLVLGALLVMFSCLALTNAFARNEKSYQNTLCHGMSQSVRLHDRTIMDCGTAKFAIEIDFSNKWAEAIGQAMHYAAVKDRRPGIILICKSGMVEAICLSHALRAEETLRRWKIPALLWRCPSDAVMLAECLERQIEPLTD